MKPLTTEPSLVHPEYFDVKPVYCVSIRASCEECGDHETTHRVYDEDQALIEFGSRAEAIEWVLDEFGVTIEKVKPIDKRGPHFE